MKLKNPCSSKKRVTFLSENKYKKTQVIIYILVFFTFSVLNINFISNVCNAEEIDIIFEQTQNIYDNLLWTENLESFWQIMMAEENREAVLGFSNEQIISLKEKVNELYGNIETPNDEDTEYKDMLIETLNILPAAECLECGISGKHADDCTKNYTVLPADGLTISANTTISATSITGTNTIWTFSNNVTATISGTITIPNGKTLIINGPGTIKRNTTADLFLVKPGGTLIINNTVINGNSLSSTGAVIHCDITGSSYASRIATVNLDGVTIKDSKRTSGMGGAIKLGDDNSYTNTVEVTIKNTTIDNTDALQGSAIMMHSYCTGNILIQNSTIKNCDATSSYAGTIRTQGTANCKLTIESCTITNNISSNNGGGVYWNARGSSARLTITGTTDNPTVISNNQATNGGGIFLSGQSISIENTHIKNNTANYGGGICMQPFDSSNSSSGVGCTLDIGSGSKILSNTASQYGGGIYMQIDSGSTTDGEDFSINIYGDATIYGNKASYGGAIAVTQKTGNAEYSAGATRKYDAYININGGTIGGTIDSEINQATYDGGAFYINREYGNDGAGYELEVNISNGTILGNKANNNGGAIYFSDNASNSNAQITVNSGTIGSVSKNIGNIATNGGAIYISGGNFTMLDGTLANNTASENGGAVYVSSGTYTMSGGNVDKNSSKNGGSAYVTGGTYKLSGGTITNNKSSENGGAIYVNKGNLEMTGGIISNNQAKSYGGGIYAASDSTDLTVTVTSGSIIGNVASKNGGGIAVNMGSGLKADVDIGLKSCKGLDESHSHPIIRDNIANENGGGFWLNGDNMTLNMYCGSINENLAILEPGSANIYQTGGIATVHSGEVGEGVIVIGGEYVYIPDNQIPEVTIIYDSNIPNNAEQKNALVTIGVEVFLPKNLFTREGYVLVGWAHTPNPTANDKIYSVGEPYLVGEKDVTVYAVWLLEGSGTIETPGIEEGKLYSGVNNGTNILMSSNSSFTTQMDVLEVQANLYTNRTLSFDKNLPNGTNITLIDLSNENLKQFFYYKVENSETKTIKLSSFVKNGTNENYTDPITQQKVDEKYAFIVELPANNTETGARQVTLIRNSADSEVAPIEQTTTYTMVEKRNFELTYSNNSGIFNDANIDNELTFSYSTVASNGDDTRYKDKQVALKISSSLGNAIPKDTKLFDGTNYYNQNGKGEFIIPFENINTSKSITLKIVSDVLKENGIGANLKVELLACDDANKPGMGEVVKKIENIALKGVELPAIKIELSKKAFRQDEFTNNLNLKYETDKLENSNISLELQKKVSSNSYVTQTGVLTKVDGNQDNTNGVFNLDFNSSGTINLEFVENFKEQLGTYRILIKGIDSNGDEFEAPCNFIIAK